MGKRVIWVLVLLSAGISRGLPHSHLPNVEFIHESASVDANEVRLARREEWRIEHFLRAVFPVREMWHTARAEDRNTPYVPLNRSVKYVVVEQEGYKFILANYRTTWNASTPRNQIVSMLAIYRIDSSGPNQVWRSRPWIATYDDSRFLTAKSRWRNVIFYQEGGDAGEFGLASVFSFINRPRGLIIRDLTPSIPWLRAVARFPFRPLYGEQMSMRLNDAHELFLIAHDEQFDVGMNQIVRPSRSWIFNQAHDRFEQSSVFTDAILRK